MKIFFDFLIFDFFEGLVTKTLGTTETLNSGFE